MQLAIRLLIGNPLLVVALLGISSTLRAEPSHVPPRANTVLIVDAKPEQMAAFDRALRPQIPSTYEQSGIGCSVDYLDGQGDEGCAVMRAGHEIPDDLEYLAYYFNDSNKSLYRKFEVARKKVHAQYPKEQLLLTFRHHEERDPDCSVQPQPCVLAPYCQQYGNCSSQTSSCTKC